MKIAILTPTFSKFSGPDRVAMNEAEELAAKGNKVTVITFKTDFNTDTQKQKGVEVVALGMPKKPFLERLYRLLFFLDVVKLQRIVSKVKGYDEVISFLYPMTLAATMAKRKNKALLYTYYDVGIASAQVFDSFPERMYMKAFSFLTKLTIRNCDRAISISKYLSDILRRETGISSQVKYVRIDTSRFNKAVHQKYKKEIAAVIKKLKLKKPVLLYVGRISPHKGVHLLLDAFKLVKEKIPSTTLVIAGKHTFPKYSEQLQKKADGVGGVVFAGYVADEEMPAYYGACDCYVTASLWEGFDMPVCESNACGKPAVAFNVGSHQEVLKSGVLIEAGDVKEFAAAVVKILKKKHNITGL